MYQREVWGGIFCLSDDLLFYFLLGTTVTTDSNRVWSFHVANGVILH